MSAAILCLSTVKVVYVLTLTIYVRVNTLGHFFIVDLPKTVILKC